MDPVVVDIVLRGAILRALVALGTFLAPVSSLAALTIPTSIVVGVDVGVGVDMATVVAIGDDCILGVGAGLCLVDGRSVVRERVSGATTVGISSKQSREPFVRRGKNRVGSCVGAGCCGLFVQARLAGGGLELVVAHPPSQSGGRLEIVPCGFKKLSHSLEAAFARVVNEEGGSEEREREGGREGWRCRRDTK